MRPDGPIRVLLIDDAPLFARAVAAELERCGGLHALCAPGEMGLLRSRLLHYHPEVIVLDLGLCALSPLTLLRKLRTHYPVPVIVVARGTDEGAARAAAALQFGALEVVRRPDSLRASILGPFAADLAAQIRLAASFARPVPTVATAAAAPRSFRAAGLNPGQYLIAIGASTGGTKAVETLLRHMPDDGPPIVVVQHMPSGFTRSFALRLNEYTAVAVSEAEDGEVLQPGQAVVARGDTHLIVVAHTSASLCVKTGRRTHKQVCACHARPSGCSAQKVPDTFVSGWSVHYTHQAPVNRHCPSADVLFESVAKVVGKWAVGVLLTGMGDDGARGLLALRRAGALTIAQNKESCVVYGMPKVAVDLGAAQFTAAPEEVASLTLQTLLERERARARAPVPRVP